MKVIFHVKNDIAETEESVEGGEPIRQVTVQELQESLDLAAVKFDAAPAFVTQLAFGA